MSVYLKQFSTHQEYDAYINGSDAILPNVSVCTTEGDVHYNPPVDPYAGHDYVEIGGLKWATMNVGATNITDYGLYFQWGDTQGYTAAQCGSGEGKKYFNWADYKYGNGTSSPGATGMTKYKSSDGKTVTTIEGNSGNACKRQTYVRGSSEIAGYGVPAFNTAPIIKKEDKKKETE